MERGTYPRRSLPLHVLLQRRTGTVNVRRGRRGWWFGVVVVIVVHVIIAA